MTTTGHARTVTIASVAPAYYRDQRNTYATHRIANQLPDGSVIGTACGRVFSQARNHMTLNGGREITCRACRES